MNIYSCIAFIVLMLCITKMVNNFINHIWNNKVEQNDKMKLSVKLESEEENDESENNDKSTYER